MGSERRPRMPGVTVYLRQNKAGTVYVGRYTLPSKQRVPIPAEPTWEDAFAKAQQRVDRNRHRDVRNGRITLRPGAPLKPGHSPPARRQDAQ